MKKPFALGLISSLITVSTSAQDNTRQAMLDTLVNHLHTSSELVKDAACLGVSTGVLEDAYEKYLYQCADVPEARVARDLESFMAALESCYMPAVLEELSISREEAEACFGAAAESRAGSAGEKYNGSDAEIEAILARLDADEPSRQTIQQLQVVQQTDVENDGRKVEGAMGSRGLIAKATQGQITLPIYKNSQIINHMADTQSKGQSGADSIDVIPAATFASPDSPKTVLEFYRRRLPGFKFKQLASDEYILMESMPDNFDLLQHMKEYISTPHVLIKKATAGSEGDLPAAAKSMIEIAYRK